MKSFKTFSKKPSVPDLVRHVLKKSGFSADANCSGGRCYEFRDALHNEMQKHGYKPVSTSSSDWIRYHSRDHGKDVGFAEGNALEADHHAWVYHKGKHYDALNPEGAKSPAHMNFYKNSLDRYRPDGEQHWYWKTKGHVYNKKTDRFEPIPGKKR